MAGCGVVANWNGMGYYRRPALGRIKETYMSTKEEIVRRLDQKHKQVVEALMANDMTRFRELFEEEGVLIDELNSLYWGDEPVPVDHPRGSRG